jgi:hypothetical protein
MEGGWTSCCGIRACAGGGLGPQGARLRASVNEVSLISEWGVRFLDEKWGEGLVLVFSSAVRWNQIHYLVVHELSIKSYFSYVYYFSYGCTAKTEISCRNTMLYYKIIKLSASTCYLRILEYHGVFTLIWCSVQTSDYSLWYIIFLIIQDIPFCLCQNIIYMSLCLKTLGLNIDYYHWKHYGIFRNLKEYYSTPIFRFLLVESQLRWGMLLVSIK